MMLMTVVGPWRGYQAQVQRMVPSPAATSLKRILKDNSYTVSWWHKTVHFTVTIMRHSDLTGSTKGIFPPLASFCCPWQKPCHSISVTNHFYMHLLQMQVSCLLQSCFATTVCGVNLKEKHFLIRQFSRLAKCNRYLYVVGKASD
jgi:hypothetical protein